MYDKDFIPILKNNIHFFDQNYKLITNFNKEVYNYLLINYISIKKLIKKYNKKNYSNTDIDLHEYKFYNDILYPKYIDNKRCNICYENGFMITTECDHEFCFNCLAKCSDRCLCVEQILY